jgi:hypothetical protein
MSMTRQLRLSAPAAPLSDVGRDGGGETMELGDQTARFLAGKLAVSPVPDLQRSEVPHVGLSANQLLPIS